MIDIMMRTADEVVIAEEKRGTDMTEMIDIEREATDIETVTLGNDLSQFINGES